MRCGNEREGAGVGHNKEEECSTVQGSDKELGGARRGEKELARNMSLLLSLKLCIATRWRGEAAAAAASAAVRMGHDCF